MKPSTTVLLSLILVVCFSLLPLQAQDAKDGQLPLTGKWVIAALERDGKADEAMIGAVRINAGAKYTILPKDGKPISGSYAVNAAVTPHTMEMTPDGGRYKGKTLLGIYKLDGEVLTVCFAEPGQERPTEFASKPGVVLVVHKKEK